MHAGRNNFRGFTLIELILVMFVLAIVAAFAAPNLGGFIQGRRGTDTATQVLGLARSARTAAISNGQIYQLNVDENSQSIWVSAVDASGASQDIKSDIGNPLVLPQGKEGLRMTCDFPSGDGGVKAARFYPTGRVDPGTITITDAQNRKYEVLCYTASEQYHIATDQELR